MANLPTAKKFDATHKRVTDYIQSRATQAAGLVNDTTEEQLRASIDDRFFGVQSDIDIFNDVSAWFCHDAYVGPRSDQLSVKDLYAVGCDRVIDLASCWGAAFSGVTKIVGCGSGSQGAIRVRSGYARTARNVSFDRLWLETQANQGTVECGLDIGPTTDSYTTANVQVAQLTVLTALLAGNTHHLQYPLRVGAADDIRIWNVGSGDLQYIDKLVEFVGSTSPVAMVGPIRAPLNSGATASLDIANSGSGKPRLLAGFVALLGGINKSPVEVYSSGPG